MTRVTRWVPHVKHEMLTLPDHMNSPPVSSGVRDARSLVYCLMFCRSLLCPFVHFIRPLGLSVLRFLASDYSFGFYTYHEVAVQR
jgi:hypothetical protein